MELHLVHYNSKYGDIGEAVAHEDGLAVIGILYSLTSGTKSSSSLQPLLDVVAKVPYPQNKAGLGQSLSLKSLLPSNPETFYRYMGSLTTPGCNEIVTWSVIQQTVKITESELETLRSLWDSDGNKLGNNYRFVGLYCIDIFLVSEVIVIVLCSCRIIHDFYELRLVSL